MAKLRRIYPDKQIASSHERAINNSRNTQQNFRGSAMNAITTTPVADPRFLATSHSLIQLIRSAHSEILLLHPAVEDDGDASVCLSFSLSLYLSIYIYTLNSDCNGGNCRRYKQDRPTFWAQMS